MSDYTFIREIEKFDIDDYTAHLGWIAPKINTIKIYHDPGLGSFYLHNEVSNRLFMFTAKEPKKLNSQVEYQKVVELYRKLKSS
jgi:hypothetical protein